MVEWAKWTWRLGGVSKMDLAPGLSQQNGLGAWVELAGWICPLTPLEVDLRIRAGEVGYGGGFIERYVTAALYPQGLTREIQIGLGIAVVAVNVIIYVIAIKRAQKGHPSTGFSLFRRTHR